MKIIIPLAHHPPYHPPNTPSPNNTTHPTPHQHTTHPTTTHPHHNHPPHPLPHHSPPHHPPTPPPPAPPLLTHPSLPTPPPPTPRTLQPPTHRGKVGPLCLIFHGLLHIVYPFSRKIFGFPYLSLKLSLTLPNKEKMLWCSYFKPFIKLANFSRLENFIPTHSCYSTTNTPTPYPTHPQRKSGALMPDISWAPPHSLPIR